VPEITVIGAAGAFGSLTEGPQYNDLSKVANYRVQMASLIDKQKEYHNDLANAKSDKEARSALEKLKSVQGQVSAFISQATGQGAMSEADKINLDRQNAVVDSVINEASSASASIGPAGISAGGMFYPIFTKLRGNLNDAIASQQDFVNGTKSVFDRGADVWSPSPDQYDRFSGEKYIKGLKFYNAPLANVSNSKTEQKAVEIELQQMREAAARSLAAKNAYKDPKKVSTQAGNALDKIQEDFENKKRSNELFALSEDQLKAEYRKTLKLKKSKERDLEIALMEDVFKEKGISPVEAQMTPTPVSPYLQQTPSN
jgi:hypothetical protein